MEFSGAEEVALVRGWEVLTDAASARASGEVTAAIEAGITINALPIVDDRPIGTFDGQLSYAAPNWGYESVVEFHRRHIVGGLGSFAVEARTYAVFGEALKRKLLLELIARPMRDSIETAVLESASAGVW